MGEGLNICPSVLGPFVTPFYTSKFPSHSLIPPRGCGALRQAELQFPLLHTSMDMNITDGTAESFTEVTYTLTERDMIEAGSPQFLDVNPQKLYPIHMCTA